MGLSFFKKVHGKFGRVYEQKAGSFATLKFESTLPNINDHEENYF